MAKTSFNVSNLPVEKFSDEIIKKANQEHIIRDSRGRSIRLKKFNSTMKYKIYEVLGNDLCQNSFYLGSVIPLFCVTEIDGVIVPLIQNKSELDALISRLGDEGVSALDGAFVEIFGEDKVKSEEEAKATVKK